MNTLPTLFILAAAWLAAFLQCALDLPHRWVGAQVDLLPALMVYAALTRGPGTIALTALAGGLWLDSLSANPLGGSVLPLLLAGAAVHHHRAVILRQETFAQITLGLAACAAAPILHVLLLFTFGHRPLASWASLGPWVWMTLAGGLATPLLFRALDRLMRAFVYPAHPSGGPHPEREIVRGRNYTV